MDNMKKSILYDVRKGFQDLQNNLLLNLTQKHEINIASFIKENIGIPLPTCTLDNFYSLDFLMETNKHKDALCSLFKRHIDVAETYNKAVHNALSAIMSKDVQIQFTAFGKQKGEIKKLNFSKTKIFSLFMDILLNKFGYSEEKRIHSFISRWFSGAKDRCGGRREREHHDKTRENVN